MNDDAAVTRREFDRVVKDHERRLDGHDTLYDKIQEAEKALVGFTETLKFAREQLVDIASACRQADQDCERCRDGIDKRLRVLERFRWQIVGIVTFLVAVPAWVGLFMMILGD